MSRPAAAAASGRKAGGPPDDERPSKFLATTDDKGELLKTIVQKQAEINKLCLATTQLIAQFMSMSSSVSYDSDGDMDRLSSDLDNMLVTSRKLNADLSPVKNGMKEHQQRVRVENSAELYLHAMTWMHELVKNNRGRWMGEVNGKKVSGPIIIDRYVRHSTVKFPLIRRRVDDPRVRKMRRDPANKAWEAVFGADTKVAEFLSELTRLGASRYFLMSFEDPKTLLDLVEDMLKELQQGQRELCPFTLAAINIYGGVQLWTAILWCLVVHEMPGFSSNNGLWAAQLLDKGEGPKGRVTTQQLTTAGAVLSQSPANWPSWIRSDPGGMGDNALWPLVSTLDPIEFAERIEEVQAEFEDAPDVEEF